MSVLQPLHRYTCVSGHPSEELDDSVGAKFYCPYALADGN